MDDSVPDSLGLRDVWNCVLSAKRFSKSLDILTSDDVNSIYEIDSSFRDSVDYIYEFLTDFFDKE